MSKVIDERIVEMRFDNKQFEAGTRETLSTIQRLKEALKFSGSSKGLVALQQSASNIKLDGLISGVRTLERRFSIFGIVGMRVIENLTDTMMNTMGRAVNYVTDSIVSGGIKRSMNIENAHFQLQALLKDEEKVQAVMDNAMESVDGTAYAYDEAAKAASMFSASGVQAGEEMMRALKGITGVAAMTNSEYQGIAEIFTTVAGNGRLMGDQLLQLSSRGLNAASTISDFFNKVNDGTAQTSEGIKQSISELTGGVTVSEKEIREWVSAGQISFQMFAESMNYAFGDSAKRANETFTGALSNMKSALARIGAGFVSPLVVQNGALVDLFNSMRIRINDIKKELVFDESIGNVNALSKQFTDSIIAMAKATKNFVDNADISKPIEILYNSVEVVKNVVRGFASILPPVGKAFNKVFSDFKMDSLVDLSKYLAETTQNFKLTKKGSELVRKIFVKLFSVVKMLVGGFKELYPSVAKIGNVTKALNIFHKTLRVVLNLAKGVGSVLKPIGEAFTSVFTSIENVSLESFLLLLRKSMGELATFTAKLRLSEEGAKNLESGFTGLFNVIKLLMDGFVGLLNAILPINLPVASLGSALLELFGYLGQGLTSFTEWARSSSMVQTACSGMVSAIQLVMEAFKTLIEKVVSGAQSFVKLETVQKILTGLSVGFKKLGKVAGPALEFLIEKLSDFKDSLLEIVPEVAIDSLDYLADRFKHFGEVVSSIDLTHPSSILEVFGEKLNGLVELARSNPGFDAFVTHILEFIQNIRKAFSGERISDKVDGVTSAFSTFIEWIKSKFSPAIKELSAADILASGMSFAGIYSLIKVTKAFSGIGKTFDSIPKVIETFKGVLEGYQKSIQADSILKIAKAIGILALALIGLSFTDMNRLLTSAGVLGVFSVALVGAVHLLAKTKGDTDTSATAMNNLAKSLSGFIKQLSGSLLGGQVSKTILSVGVTFGLLTAAILKIADVYKKDAGNLKQALVTLGAIAGVFAGFMAVFMILGGLIKGSGESFLKAAKGMSFFATAILIVVQALSKLMKLKFPSDWEAKVAILSAIFLGLTGVITILTLLGRVGGGNEGPYKSVVGMGLALISVVSALNKLFKMKLPNDWPTKVAILTGILGALTTVMLLMSVAARIAKGNLRIGGTLTGMAALIGAIATSLGALALVKDESLMKGAKAIGAVLLTLAVTLSQAAKATDKGAAETVKGMSSVIMTIAGSLAILAMIDGPSLLKGAIALDSVLLVLSQTFKNIGTISNDKSYLTVFAMVAVLITLSYSLYTLSEQPWESMLASGAAMAATILAFGYAFEQLGVYDKVDIKTVGTFLALTLAVIPIGAALYILSSQPWEGMIASGAAMSLTVLAFAKAFSTLEEAKDVNIKTVGTFLALTLAVIPIGAALYILSSQPWEGMLAAAGSISLTLVALTAVIAILEKIGRGGTIGAALKGIAMLDLLIADLLAVLLVLGALVQNEKVQALLNGGLDALVDIGEGLGEFVGALVGGALGGIVDGTLKAIGTGLSDFMIEAEPFFERVGSINADTMQAVKYLAEAMLALVASDLIAKISGLESLNKFSAQLPELGSNIKTFSDNVAGINTDNVKSAASAAKMMAEVAKNLPYADESLMGKIFGKKSLAEFGAELVAFGPSIANFATIVSGIKNNAVKGAASAAEMMAEVANGLDYDPESFMGKVFGRKTLAEFGNELVAFGPKIAGFAVAVSEVKKNAVKGAASAAEMMAEVANKLPYADDTLIAKIFGKKSLSEFGAELELFGPYIAGFAESVGDVDPASVQGARTVAETFVTISNALPSDGGFFQKITGKKSLKQFGESLKTFGEDLAEFCQKVSEIGGRELYSVTSKISTLVETLESSSSEAVTAFLKSFRNSKNDVVDAIKKMVDFATNAIKNKNSLFSERGVDSVTNFIGGFKSKNELVTQAGVDVVNAAIYGVMNTISSMESAGADVAQGFINGVNSKQGEAAIAGTNLGMAAYEAARRALDIQSPSKKMAELGYYAAQGLIRTLYSYTSKAYTAGKDLTSSVMDGAKSSSIRLVNAIDEDWNLSPVVTPQVDLSNIEENSKKINSMFTDSVYTVRANAAFVNGSMNRFQQQQNETPILDLLNALLPKLNTGGDTYSINGINYTESSDVAGAIKTLIRATNVKRRV